MSEAKQTSANFGPFLHTRRVYIKTTQTHGVVHTLFQYDVRYFFPFMIALTTMQCANEHNLIAALQYIVAFAFKLPVSIVDEDKNSRSSAQSER